MNLKILLPPYFNNMIPHKRFKGLKGGRGSAKTTSVAIYFVLIAYAEKCRLLCCREIQKSIKQSSYASIKKAVEFVGLSDQFIFNIDRIICKRTGSEFIFQGLKSNIEQIKSMESIKYVWIEEAESLTQETLSILTPTIREKDSEIWATWNPKYPTDPIELLFQKYNEEAILVHVNYNDNPFFPEALEKERVLCNVKFPEEYNHVWLGSYAMSHGARTILPYEKLKQCINAHKKLKYREGGWAYIGLDVADGGRDKPAYALRRGSVLLEVSELADKNGYEIARTIYPIAISSRVARCHYDATGVGASIKAEFFRIQKFGKLPFLAEPFLFGGAVKGKDTIYAHGISNVEFFSRLNAQGYWNLRLRMENTLRALRGEKVNLNYCLFFDQSISEKALQELSQVVYDTDNADKIKIDKSPDGTMSPNMADAIMMSFVKDLTGGLRAI